MKHLLFSSFLAVLLLSGCAQTTTRTVTHEDPEPVEEVDTVETVDVIIDDSASIAAQDWYDAQNARMNAQIQTIRQQAQQATQAEQARLDAQAEALNDRLDAQQREFERIRADHNTTDWTRFQQDMEQLGTDIQSETRPGTSNMRNPNL